MTDQIRFIAYCIEEYKADKDMSGGQVFSLFRLSGALDYLWDSYDALHTTGPRYTVDQIDAFISAAGAR
jgi:hypothetical protein